MLDISLLVSPEVKGAYFSEYIECSKNELLFCIKDREVEVHNVGNLVFFNLSVEEVELKAISKLSFFQGAFKRDRSSLTPLEIVSDFKLTDQFIFGSKFKGKTNERFTQLMLNIGLAACDSDSPKVLDPMCGRATSLLWAMRYGLNAKGIELDSRAILDINQIVKKWSKVCGISSKTQEGFVGKKNKFNHGKFLEFNSEGQTLKVVIGSSEDAPNLLSNEKFDLLLSDIPYGIQHMASKKSINPMQTLELCFPSWKKVMKKGAVLVIGYNSNNPKRGQLEELATASGFNILDFQIPHRMSESIVRDVIVLKNL